MKIHLMIAGALTLLLSGPAMAQHGGTEQEQRPCAGNVQRYCRPILDQGDFAVLACLQQHREKLTLLVEKSLPMTASDRHPRDLAGCSWNDSCYRRFT
jgi:hypothetical protein